MPSSSDQQIPGIDEVALLPSSRERPGMNVCHLRSTLCLERPQPGKRRVRGQIQEGLHGKGTSTCEPPGPGRYVCQQPKGTSGNEIQTPCPPGPEEGCSRPRPQPPRGDLAHARRRHRLPRAGHHSSSTPSSTSTRRQPHQPAKALASTSLCPRDRLSFIAGSERHAPRYDVTAMLSSSTAYAPRSTPADTDTPTTRARTRTRTRARDRPPPAPPP